MKFIKTRLGAYIIELEPRKDDRGQLVRTWSKDEFDQNGINLDLLQGYISYTKKKGTMRGIHYRTDQPYVAQLTKCITGSYYEVIVDLRPESKNFKKWEGFEIHAEDEKLLYIPEGFGHAVLTLEDDTIYMDYYNGFYRSEIESGIRYNDPAFNISWPIDVKVVSDKDKSRENYK